MIIPSKVEREFIIEFGFLDTAPDVGFMTIINRFFNSFLIGSITCYTSLYLFLRKQNKLALRRSRRLREGENRIFALLLITTFLYLALFTVFEYITFQDWNNGSGSLLGKWLKRLAIANYLPEISLPVFFIVDNLDFTKKCRRFLGTPTDVQRMST
ncbi:hypothetical protein L3Y34_012887 [Caenorhabditis briggsae]|nr:hypothetical protein L3Y34_012887 [Caenorhabditis briggsae]